MRRAQTNETDAIIAFYHKLIKENSSSPYPPDWRIDIYPTDTQIADYIRRGEMYVLDTEQNSSSSYIAAFALSSEPVEGYDTVPWCVPASWEDVIVVHLLCVDCAYHRQGIGRMIVQALLDLCRAMNKQAVRLDVMTKNLPAQKLYTAAGFAPIGTWCITYEDTGPMEFLMYEFDLRTKGSEHHDQ